MKRTNLTSDSGKKETGDGSLRIGKIKIADPRGMRAGLTHRAKRTPVTLPPIGKQKP